eukprot:GHVS01106903.1.p1 GENE.GHVS01106903.1~~GHVS01106903.1.p1  ORF type:complete len:125 (-),score=17.44 GHVS01106903.1:365-739(-)
MFIHRPKKSKRTQKIKSTCLLIYHILVNEHTDKPATSSRVKTDIGIHQQPRQQQQQYIYSKDVAINPMVMVLPDLTGKTRSTRTRYFDSTTEGERETQTAVKQHRTQSSRFLRRQQLQWHANNS